MRLPRLRWRSGLAPAVLVFLLAMSSGLQAQDADLSSSVTLPDEIWLGTPFTVTVGYANDGPDIASNAYPNGEFIPPMGLDVFLDNYWNGDGSMFDDLQGSATDSLGNVPLLFWDDYNCETVQFQVQGAGQPGPIPIAPLDPGAGGSFSFVTALPMSSPRTGAVEITSPASLAQTWTLTDPSNFFVEHGYGTIFSTYSTTTCEQLVGDPEEDVCNHIDDNCWGTKVSHLAAPITAELVLVDDGSAAPTLGCGSFVNDVAGKIAVIERGTCEFGVKGFNAELAGALAVFMVNDGRCSDFPASLDCVINMGPGALGGLVTILMVQVSLGDGAAILAALNNDETVTGVFGSASTFAALGWTYHGGGSADTDPDNSNDVALVKAPTADRGLDHAPVNPEIGELVILSLYGFTDDLIVDWDFGEDGCMPDHPQQQECLPNFVNCHQFAHRFSSAGQKTVTAEIYDADTNAYLGTATETITVENVGICGSALPIDFTISDNTPDIGQFVGFSVTGIPAGDIESAVWEFGGIGCDQTTSYTCNQGWPIGCDQAAFAYESGGVKIVTLTVSSLSSGPQLPVQHAVVVAYAGSCGGSTCTYSISPTSRGFPVGGGNGTFSVVTQAGCSWTAVEDWSWITVTAGSGGIGPGTVSYSVAPNTGGARVGTIAVAGRTHTVMQERLEPLFADGFETGDTGAWGTVVPPRDAAP